jgi:ribonuclease P protein subunit RPR2
MKRKEAKKQAALMAKKALELSVGTAGQDLLLAKEQASLARRLMLKYNVRLDWPLKRFICSGCKELIVPGVNARVRISRGAVLTTCSSCGRVNRKILGQA